MPPRCCKCLLGSQVPWKWWPASESAAAALPDWRQKKDSFLAAPARHSHPGVYFLPGGALGAAGAGPYIRRCSPKGSSTRSSGRMLSAACLHVPQASRDFATRSDIAARTGERPSGRGGANSRAPALHGLPARTSSTMRRPSLSCQVGRPAAARDRRVRSASRSRPSYGPAARQQVVGVVRCCKAGRAGAIPAVTSARRRPPPPALDVLVVRQ